MDAGGVILTAALAVAGAAVGWCYFAILRASVEQMTSARGWGKRFALFAALRVTLFAGGLAAALWAGTWPLIAYLAGFIVARTVAVARARRGIVDAPSADGASGPGA